MSSAQDKLAFTSRPDEAQRIDDPRIERLIFEVAQGDRAALKHLYEMCAPRLFSILTALVTQREVAEDLLRDVFLTIWLEASQFDVRREKASAWLIGLTRRQCAVAVGRGQIHLTSQFVPSAPCDQRVTPTAQR